MTPKQLGRIEAQARRMRAEVLSEMVRSLFRRVFRVTGTPTQTA